MLSLNNVYLTTIISESVNKSKIKEMSKTYFLKAHTSDCNSFLVLSDYFSSLNPNLENAYTSNNVLFIFSCLR